MCGDNETVVLGATMPNEAVLEQSRFVPGWLHIRHGASTEKLDEIGLMRMGMR